MLLPANYNAVTLNMTPAEISSTDQALELAVDEVISSLEVINSTLNDLALGWAGTTAAEVKDFGDQWTAAMNNLFGSGKKTSVGVLGQAITALGTAAGNYSSAEQCVASMFNALNSSLSVKSPGGSNTTPIPAGTSVTDGSLSAVGESNWTTSG